MGWAIFEGSRRYNSAKQVLSSIRAVRMSESFPALVTFRNKTAAKLLWIVGEREEIFNSELPPVLEKVQFLRSVCEPFRLHMVENVT